MVEWKRMVYMIILCFNVHHAISYVVIIGVVKVEVRDAVVCGPQVS